MSKASDAPTERSCPYCGGSLEIDGSCPACERADPEHANASSPPRALSDSELPTVPEAPGSGEFPTNPRGAEKEGDAIGRYRLLHKIGEGGMGVVWAAEQTEPVRRRVALKIIKLGMDTGEVATRFEAERQALALMDHPGIATILDAVWCN